jgi:hypothetical protein
MPQDCFNFLKQFVHFVRRGEEADRKKFSNFFLFLSLSPDAQTANIYLGYDKEIF